MLKMNTKKANANACEWLKACALEDGAHSVPEYIEMVNASFKEWMRGNLRGASAHYYATHSLQDHFREWVFGCCGWSCFDYVGFRMSASETLARILEETPEEAERFTEEQAEEKLTAFLYCHIFQPWLEGGLDD